MNPEEARKHLAQVQEELISSHKSLLPLADHVQASYAACKTKQERAEAFATAKQYVTQALASVAYQVNEAASELENLLQFEEQEVSNLFSLTQLPRQQIHLHMEHLGRRAIAALTMPRQNAKTKKIVKTQNDPVVAPFARKPITFDELDGIGHGTVEAHDAKKAVVAQHETTERRYSNVYSARTRQKAEPDTSVEDIYGTAAPLAALSRVSIPKAPMPVRVAAPVAPKVPAPPHVSSTLNSQPQAPAHPSFSSQSRMMTLPPVPPPPPPPPVGADHLYEDPNAVGPSKVAPKPPHASLPPLSPPPPAPQAVTDALPAPPSMLLPPPPPVETILGQPICRAVALFDYVATQHDELSFFENEILDILAKK